MSIFGLLFRNIFSVTFKAKRHKPKQVPFKNWTITRGDKVKIRTGDDKGKVSRVMKVHRKRNLVVVYGINKKVKYEREEGGQVVKKNKSYPIHVSNVGLYDSQAKKAVRIYYAFHPETYEKLRVSKKSGKVLLKPKRNYTLREKRGKNRKLGTKDTNTEKAHAVTYEGEDFAAVKREFEEFIKEKERREKLLVFSE